MMDGDFSFDPYLFVGFFVAILAAVETALYLWRRRRQSSAINMLEQAKREVQEMAQLPLNNPHPLIQISEQGQIVFANPAAYSLFPGLDRQGTQHNILDGLADIFGHEIGTVITREAMYKDKAYQQTIAVQRAGSGKTVIVYCHDITARMEHERGIEKARAAAEQANKARGDFLANMSHELRTPMNGIIGLSDMLAAGKLPPEQKEMAGAVNHSARNLLILLNDILDFSKIEAGELGIEKISFDMRKALKQVELLQASAAERKGLSFTVEVDETVPRYLVGDPARWQQILNNLIGNALKFTEQGGVSVGLSAEEQNDGLYKVCLQVSDTGPGIPVDKQAQIFEKFQQADTSTARKYGGTGLGLAITRDLCRLMGGGIGVSSQAGTGSVFTVTVPMAAGEGDVADDGTVQAGVYRIDLQARLLVVDDHPVNLLFMRKMLRRTGFKNFDEVDSGKAALRLFEEGTQYDLVLMDCQMPEMSGYEVAAKIRETEHADTAPVIIAVTADAMKGAEEKCLSSGMDDYLSKPVDRDKLMTILQRWLPGDDIVTGDDDAVTDSAPSSAVIFDCHRLDEFTDGDPDAERQLINIFIDNLEMDLTALRDSFEKGDRDKWDNIVHKICGSCFHVGANALAQICDEAQALPDGAGERVPQLHEAIIDEYEKVRRFLEGRKAA